MDAATHPRPLAEILAKRFSSAVRARGRAYADDGRVKIVEQTGHSALAEVFGSSDDPYLVEIVAVMRGPDRAHVWMACDCPHWEGGDACKHLYATLIELDDTGETLGIRPGARIAASLERSPESDAAEVVTYDRPETPRGGGEPWQSALTRLSTTTARAGAAHGAIGAMQRPRDPWFVLGRSSRNPESLVIHLYERVQNAQEKWGKLKTLSASRSDAAAYANDDARPLLVELMALARASETYSSVYYDDPRADRVDQIVVPPPAFRSLLPRLCASGRLAWTTHRGEPGSLEDLAPLHWSDVEHTFEIVVEPRPDGIAVCGILRQTDDPEAVIRLGERTAAVFPGLVVCRDHLSPLRGPLPIEWIDLLTLEGDLSVRSRDVDRFVCALADLSACPPLVDFECTGWTRERRTPAPRVHFTTPERRAYNATYAPVEARLSFDYTSDDDHEGVGATGAGEPSPLDVRLADLRCAVVDPERRLFIARDAAAERAIVEEVVAMGAKRLALAPPPLTADPYDPPALTSEFEVAPREFNDLALRMLERGWCVEADGRPWRRSSGSSISVRSGVDWLELQAHVEFEGGERVALPELLRALRERQTSVVLGDGSRGLLPERWLARMLPFAQLGTETDEALQFAPTQSTILDALLSAREADGEDAVAVDARFRKLRQRLGPSQRISPRDAPRGFRGELRPYQREGLGWLRHTQQLGLGGCLADDMGLGKTVQILALLASRGGRRGGRRPSVVVTPSSVLSHWIDEAERFAPRLRVVAYRGPDRQELLDDIEATHLVVMSYAVLRRDIGLLSEIAFDYAILDEAQAIKNPRSQLARSVRLLRAEHRLALTGTPVENHLGDLFSIFEFLNPGLLGRAPSVQKLARSRGEDDSAAVEALARGLRPLIFRRTKAEVLTDLPEKTEQTLTIDLTAKERSQYDELRRHYRRELFRKVERDGVERSRIVILEALLRLRQAACHPALIDPARAHQPSAKLDVLMSQLESVIEDDHKVLVFSQFTRLLRLVCDRLDTAAIGYSYLDGRTRKRADKIEAFQNDPTCPVFVISLKAGGVGLNLTAADYVYLLDPWWNPAVESQAIDRAHRIGQKRPVFGYRLIARDTVEERVLELQASKRELADAFLEQARGSLAAMSLADLDALLS